MRPGVAGNIGLQHRAVLAAPRRLAQAAEPEGMGVAGRATEGWVGSCCSPGAAGDSRAPDARRPGRGGPPPDSPADPVSTSNDNKDLDVVHLAHHRDLISYRSNTQQDSRTAPTPQNSG